MRLLRSTRHAILARLLPLLVLLVLGSAACSDLAPVTGDAGADTTDQSSEDVSEPADDATDDDTAGDDAVEDAETVTPITAEQVELVCSDDGARATTAADVGVSEDIIAEVCSLLYPAQ